MKKFVCIHGHFYQPPRENPWTGEVDEEPSAKPFHDWNERIAKECYAANTSAPVLNSKGQTTTQINNYRNISFDFGPTLLSWMRRHDPKTYAAIQEADAQSVQDHGGHGNAIAQVYNHLIMPLAKKRDKITQVIWGIRDFEYHFKRKPEGMWLSETAVDIESLSILADQGIRYTVLAPHQAKRIRRVGFGSRWQYVHNESVDPKRAYRVLLDWGKQFNVFFYDGPISRAIAFQGLLYNGDQLDHKLLNAFGHGDAAQLVHTATDGESFGHHHKFGEMAIAYGLKKVQDHHMAAITNYAEFLDRFGSSWEAEIYPNSSWSCAHGVERWRSDCGCRLNFEEGWNQKWRTILRDAFDYLQEIVDEVYENQAGKLLKDPWKARNDYVDLMLEDTPERRRAYFAKNARREPSVDQEKKILELLEAEKFSLFMYTSCGWFFDDISGIEPVQCMKFALRAMELVQSYYPKDIESAMLAILVKAKSNVPNVGTGADVFRNYVKPARNIKISSSERVVKNGI